MTARVVVVSTALGLATVSAAYEAGLLEVDGPQVLVVTANAAMPETATPLSAVAGVAGLQSRFAAVHDLNETIEPLHPAGWRPRVADLPVWQRHLRLVWGLGDADVTLLVESIAVEPALALARIFADAAIEVYAEGLMSYGPTRNALPASVGGRVARLLHLDLVPGLVPVLLSEWEVPTVVIPAAAFRSVITAMSGPSEIHRGPRTALVLGQYLASLDLLTEDEELGLYAEIARRCAAAGCERVVFKQHPGAPALQGVRLIARAGAQGTRIEVADGPELAEAWFARGDVDLVVGCFSTGLMTARTAWGLAVARLGTELLLERLTPFQNSNRIPVVLVDATVPELGDERLADGRSGCPADVQGLVNAVGYAMQPLLLADRRSGAVSHLASHPDQRGRYVKQRRLTRLGLPGALPASSSWSRPVRRARRLLARVVASQPG